MLQSRPFSITLSIKQKKYYFGFAAEPGKIFERQSSYDVSLSDIAYFLK